MDHIIFQSRKEFAKWVHIDMCDIQRLQEVCPVPEDDHFISEYVNLHY